MPSKVQNCLQVSIVMTRGGGNGSVEAASKLLCHLTPSFPLLHFASQNVSKCLDYGPSPDDFKCVWLCVFVCSCVYSCLCKQACVRMYVYIPIHTYVYLYMLSICMFFLVSQTGAEFISNDNEFISFRLCEEYWSSML